LLMGSVIANVDPTPGVLLTSMLPLCRLTICFTIERPSPVPPSLLECDLSTV